LHNVWVNAFEESPRDHITKPLIYKWCVRLQIKSPLLISYNSLHMFCAVTHNIIWISKIHSVREMMWIDRLHIVQITHLGINKLITPKQRCTGTYSNTVYLTSYCNIPILFKTVVQEIKSGHVLSETSCVIQQADRGGSPRWRLVWLQVLQRVCRRSTQILRDNQCRSLRHMP